MASPGTCVRGAQRRASHHGGAERDSQGAGPNKRSLGIHFLLSIYGVITRDGALSETQTE